MIPRSYRAAARTVSILCTVGALVSLIFAPYQPQQHHVGTRAMLVAGGVVVVVILLALSTRFFAETSHVAWTAGPLLAVTAIVALDLATHDAAVSAQIFTVFPVLYGASQLPVLGSVVMTAASIVAEVVVVASQLPFDDALVDAGYVVAVLVTTSYLLTVSTERQARLLARLEQMAAVDPLTGLVTRRVLDEAATSALSGASSADGTSLILLDVDEFKAINDAHGHPAGDAVLIQLSRVIVERTRSVDVVCRLGGDEIAVLMPACARAAAWHRAHELLDSVGSHPFEIEGVDEPLRLSISVGLAHAPSDAQDLSSLYAAADAALYQAKRAGRARVFQAGDLTAGDATGETSPQR